MSLPHYIISTKQAVALASMFSTGGCAAH